MEDIVKCPICNEENKHQIWTERGIGTVEEYYFCENCGYFMEMAYSPVHDGIELLRGRKVLRQLLLLFRFRKKIAWPKVRQISFLSKGRYLYDRT